MIKVKWGDSKCEVILDTTDYNSYYQEVSQKALAYRIEGKFGNELILAVWRILSKDHLIIDWFIYVLQLH